MALGVGLCEPFVLGQDHRLNHVEALGGPALEIALGLFGIEPMKQLPRRIPHVKERFAELIEQVMVIFADPGGIGRHPR